LLNNQLVFRSLHSLLRRTSSRLKHGVTLKQIPVAIDSIAIAVNHNLNIPGLTVAQLKDIYTGKLTNWNSVGGPNLKLHLLRRPGKVAQVKLLPKIFGLNSLWKMSDKEELGSNVQFIPTTTEALREVAKIQEAFTTLLRQK